MPVSAYRAAGISGSFFADRGSGFAGGGYRNDSGSRRGRNNRRGLGQPGFFCSKWSSGKLRPHYFPGRSFLLNVLFPHAVRSIARRREGPFMGSTNSGRTGWSAARSSRVITGPVGDVSRTSSARVTMIISGSGSGAGTGSPATAGPVFTGSATILFLRQRP